MGWGKTRSFLAELGWPKVDAVEESAEAKTRNYRQMNSIANSKGQEMALRTLVKATHLEIIYTSEARSSPRRQGAAPTSRKAPMASSCYGLTLRCHCALMTKASS